MYESVNKAISDESCQCQVCVSPFAFAFALSKECLMLFLASNGDGLMIGVSFEFFHSFYSSNKNKIIRGIFLA